MEPDDVLAELQKSGVRGRGGAGFAMGKKASFLPKGTMDKYLVCNADESEPGTFKDRELMQKNPHLLIEGMIIAAWAAGINRSFIFIRGEYEHQADVLDAALEEARAAGYLGERILKLRPHARHGRAPRRRRLHLRRGDRAARRARGQARQPAPEAAVPRAAGPLPRPDADQQRRDADERPASSSRMGGEEYAKIGTANSTGTKVVSVSGNVRRPGNYEIELGVPSREIIMGLAGGPREGRKVKAWFPGGSSAPVLPGSDEYLDLPYDFDSLAKAGSMLGSGAIIVIDDSVSIVDVALQDGEVLRATSRAASARRAARARTGRRRCSSGSRTGTRPRWTSTSWPRSRSRSSATACACSATRWRCRSAR